MQQAEADAARRKAEEADSRVPYVWLEIYSWTALVLFAVIFGMSSLDYFEVLNIGAWYSIQLLAVGFSVSMNFFLGRPTLYAEGHRTNRPLFALVYTGMMAVGSISAGLVFIILNVIYVASSASCVSSDPATICGGHVAAFVILTCFCAALIAVFCLLIWTLIKVWSERPKRQ